MQIDKVISFIRSQKNGFFLIEVRTDSQLEAIENTLKDIFFEKQYEIDTSFFSIKPEDASKSISIEQIRKLKKEFLHTNVFHMKRELGDICWYLAQACMALDTTFDEIIEMNVDKLKARYPGGEFDVHKSENRREGDL